MELLNSKTLNLLFDIHTHNESSSGNIVIRNEFPFSINKEGFFSVGIHPWYFSEDDWQSQWETVTKKVKYEHCAAIGECGLDRNVKYPLSLQKTIFERHILLSEEVKKPLIIHCVKAYSELISLKKKYQPQQPWILHGFNKNQAVATTLINENIKLSFGKSLLTNITVQEVFKSIPEGSYFLETDDSGLDIAEIYQKAKQLRGLVQIQFDYPKIGIMM